MVKKKVVMGYRAPADTTHLLELLGGSKPLLKKFQGALGLRLAESSRNRSTSVEQLHQFSGSTVSHYTMCRNCSGKMLLLLLLACLRKHTKSVTAWSSVTKVSEHWLGQQLCRNMVCLLQSL